MTDLGQLDIRMTFQFPKGDVIVMDGPNVTPTETAQLRDPGEAALLLDGGDDSCQVTIDNVPDASGNRFSDNWTNADPPEGAKVVCEFRTSSTGAWEKYFVGAIDEVSAVTETDVTIAMRDQSGRFYRDIGDPITRTDFPNASNDAISRIKPICFGTFEQFTPPLIRDRQSGLLQTAILATDIINEDTGNSKVIQLDDTTNWPEHLLGERGFLKINDEVFEFTTDNVAPANTTDLILTQRAQNGTDTAAHVVGDTVTENAKMKWLVSGHPCKSIDAVYGITSGGKKVLLDPSTYTVSLGAIANGTDDPCTIELVSETGLSISAPGDSPTYRRVEMDAVATPAIGSKLPSGMNALTNANQAKDATFAAAASGEWDPDNYALMRKFGHDTLSVAREGVFTQPGPPLKKAWVAVEYYGLGKFGTSTKLTTAISSTDGPTFNITVDNINDMLGAQDADSLFGASPDFAYIRIRDEIFLINAASGGEDNTDNNVNVTRAQFGSVAVNHNVGAEVHAYALFGNEVQEPILHFPPVIALYEDSAGDMNTLAQLGDVSSTPVEIQENDTTFQDSKAITAWHGHPITGLPKVGKWFVPETDVTTAGYELSRYVGSLLVSSVVPRTQATGGKSQNKIDQQRLPHTSDITAGYGLSTYSADPVGQGLSYILNPISSLGVNINQRVLRMTIRYAHGATGTVNSGGNTTFVEVWCRPTDNPVAVQIHASNTKAFKVAGDTRPQFRTAVVHFNKDNGYPNGVQYRHLLSRHFTIRFFNTSGGGQTRLFYASVDFVFADDQLIDNQGEPTFIADLTVIETGSSFALANASSSYDNSGIPGPPGGYEHTKIVPELIGDSVWALLTSDASKNFFIRNEVGNQNGIVRFKQGGGSTVYDVDTVTLAVTNLRAPAKARVRRVSLFAVVAGRGNQIAEPDCVFEIGSITMQPTSTDKGNWTTYDGHGNNFSRRNFRYTFNLEALDVTVKKLIRKGAFVMSATSSSAQQDCYMDYVVLNVEVDEDREEFAKSVNAQQYTRVRYMDISSYVSTYSDVIDRKFELRWLLKGFTHLTFLDAVHPNEQDRPILVGRAWYVFRYDEERTEDLVRIAVDGKGIEQFPNAIGFDSIANVLTYGTPLLNAKFFGDIADESFVTAFQDGMLPINGVLDQRTPARDLLATMTEQAIISGYWEDDGNYTVKFKTAPSSLASPTVVFSESAGHILKGSLTITRRPKETVRNRVKVNAGRDWIKGGYRLTSAYRAPASIAKYGEHQYEVNADFLRTQAETDKLALQLLRYGKEPEVIVRWQTSLFDDVKTLKRGRVVGVTHTLFSSTRLEVVGINKAKGTVQSGIPVYEIEAVERENAIDEEKI